MHMNSPEQVDGVGVGGGQGGGGMKCWFQDGMQQNKFAGSKYGIAILIRKTSIKYLILLHFYDFCKTKQVAIFFFG